MPSGNVEFREVWRPAFERDVEVLQIRNTEKRCGMFHERFAISFCQTGTGTVRYRGRTGEHDRGSLFFIEPGEAHTSPAATGPLGWDVLFVEESLLRDAAEVAGIRGSIHWRSIIARDPSSVRLFTQTLSAFRAAGERDNGPVALANLLDAVLRRHAESGGDRPAFRDSALVRKLKHRLRDLVHDGVSIADLARDYGISVCHLVRSFSAEVGIPPHQYLLQLRIERARGLLAHMQSPMAVAHELGFFDESHFHRHFTKIVGVTPGRYARAVR